MTWPIQVFVDIKDPVRHSYSLEVIPLEVLMEGESSDLSWLLDDRFVLNCYTSALIFPEGLFLFKDILTAPVITSEQLISQPIH